MLGFLLAAIILIWAGLKVLGSLFSGDSSDFLGTLLGIFIFFGILSAIFG